MSRHTVQIKALLQNKRLGKSRFNPQASMKYLPDSPPINRSLKRCESSSILSRKKQSNDMSIIQQRYKKLQQNYRLILQQTKSKAQLFQKQKSELEKYQQQSQKDKKQIQRLRSMLGFMKKQDKGIQVDNNYESRITYDKDTSKLSYYSKNQKSTDIGMNQTTDNLKRKQRKKSNLKQSKAKTPYKLINNKSQSTIYLRSSLKQSNTRLKQSHLNLNVNMKSPMLAKYKFVPTLNFIN